MTARDRFTAKLKCPQCGRAGEARLSENDGWSYQPGEPTQVDYLPPGFRSIRKPGEVPNVDLLCEACNVSAYA